jgi:uncharacterized protein YlzI (FlbEa/FlbD family)
MIWLTKLDGSPILLNDDHILVIEVLHDTLISLVNGDSLRVLESPDEITRRVARWRRRISGLELLAPELGREAEEG